MPTDLPLSVWPTAQQTARAQRAGRYVEISGHHPAKMLPAIAQRAIATYTRPGDLVARPDVRHRLNPRRSRPPRPRRHRGRVRTAVGRRWPEPTSPTPEPRAPPAMARWSAATPATSPASSTPPCAAWSPWCLPPRPTGRPCTAGSPPGPGQGIAKSHHRYSTDPANLAHVGLAGLLDAMRTILAGCAVAPPRRVSWP